MRNAIIILQLKMTVFPKIGGGYTVYMNPPYGRHISDWVKKASEECTKPGTTVVALIPARTDTKWFWDYVLPYADIRFIKGRLRFSGAANPAPFANLIAIYPKKFGGKKMLNKIMIQGRFVRDPELRTTQNGTYVTSFTLAVDRDYADKDSGNRGTDFIDCVAWRNTAQFVNKYFTKGSMAVVAGRLQIRSYDGNDGIKRKAADINVEDIYFAGAKQSTTATPSAVENTEFTELTAEDGDLPF